MHCNLISKDKNEILFIFAYIFFGINSLQATIIISDYHSSDRSAVLAILLQDPFMIYPGKESVESNEVSMHDFLAGIKDSFDNQICTDSFLKKVVRDQGNVVGFLCYSNKGMLEEEHVELSLIAIDRLARRNGNATLLLESAIKDSQQKWPTIKKMKVDVLAFNADAQKFYQKRGFKSDLLVDFSGLITYEKNLKEEEQVL